MITEAQNSLGQYRRAKKALSLVPMMKYYERTGEKWQHFGLGKGWNISRGYLFPETGLCELCFLDI